MRSWSRRGRAHYLQHKGLARELVHTRIAHFNQFYSVPIRKVFIKNHKRRWGSCSERGNLNFNYKILFLPQEIADYIIVHELCHLLEFNHSSRFWAHVARAMPEHRTQRKILRHIERRNISGYSRFKRSSKSRAYSFYMDVKKLRRGNQLWQAARLKAEVRNLGIKNVKKPPQDKKKGTVQ